MKELSDKLDGEQAQAQNSSQKYALDEQGNPYKCSREECNNLVPLGRKKYCGSDCSKIVSEKNAKKYAAQQRKPGKVFGAKWELRTCLGCEKDFMSQGPWNRFCLHCIERNTSYSSRRY